MIKTTFVDGFLYVNERIFLDVSRCDHKQERQRKRTRNSWTCTDWPHFSSVSCSKMIIVDSEVNHLLERELNVLPHANDIKFNKKVVENQTSPLLTLQCFGNIFAVARILSRYPLFSQAIKISTPCDFLFAWFCRIFWITWKYSSRFSFVYFLPSGWINWVRGIYSSAVSNISRQSGREITL